jgi:hypothetical protein
MLHRQHLLNSLGAALAALALVACAPGSRSDDDDTAGADAAVTVDGGGGFIDGSSPVPDGHDVHDTFTVYVHSKDTLYTMDPVSFALTTVGKFNPPTADDITDLAVAGDGKIFVISKTRLYTADANDAHATFVANLSSTPTAGNVGLTFLPDGDLLATDKTGGIRSINPTSGAVLERGMISNGFRTAGDLVAVEDGTMYAISDYGPDGNQSFNSNWLIKVNPANGAALQVGQIGVGGVFGAAFINGKVIVFTKTGQIVEVDRSTGHGTVKAETVIEFWGAGVSPLVPPVG